MSKWLGLLLRGDEGTDGGSEPYTEAQLRETIRSYLEREAVHAYLKQVGLKAWIPHLEKHLPANCKSVALVRATTAADLRRMGTKANMRLDNQTIQQVLNALGKK